VTVLLLKVNQAHYGPGQALRTLGVFPEFLDNRRMKVERMKAVSIGRLYPPGETMILISVGGGVDRRAIVRAEVLDQ
jgi:hypothetical protein